MKLINKPIAKKELKQFELKTFGNLVKAVIDVEKEIMIVGGSMHADEEQELLKQGSKQDNLWGINLYPNSDGDIYIEFDSMINIRPRLNNFSRTVTDVNLQNKIKTIVQKLIQK